MINEKPCNLQGFYRGGKHLLWLGDIEI